MSEKKDNPGKPGIYLILATTLLPLEPYLGENLID